MEEWYLSRGGSQEGPLTEEQLRDLVEAQGMDLSKVFVWKKGMDDWRSALSMGLSDDRSSSLKTKPGLKLGANPSADSPLIKGDDQVPPSATAAEAFNPYLAPRATPTPASTVASPYRYGGYGRVVYFLINFGFVFACVIAANHISPRVFLSGDFYLTYNLVIVGGMMLISLKRFKNLGMSGWWALTVILPILSLLTTYWLFLCPEGYGDHRKLDLGGKILVSVILLLIVGGLGILISIW